MDRSSIRAWRRIQKKRVWNNRLRLIFRTFLPTYVEDSSTGIIREAETWKELRKVKGFQVFRTTGHPCSCLLCTGVRYKRVDFKKDAMKAIAEELEM